MSTLFENFFNFVFSLCLPFLTIILYQIMKNMSTKKCKFFKKVFYFYGLTKISKYVIIIDRSFLIRLKKLVITNSFYRVHLIIPFLNMVCQVVNIRKSTPRAGVADLNIILSFVSSCLSFSTAFNRYCMRITIFKKD